MIFVDRSRVEPPRELLVYQREELARVQALMAMPELDRAQIKLFSPMPRGLNQLIVDQLSILFNGRCAFCERAGSHAEQFRPRWRATRLHGEVDGEHYWWLANEWDNLHLCCGTCDMNKRNLFPIEGPAAPPLTTGPALREERPLLIDPCVDDPRDHLTFQEDGLVVAKSDHGDATIKILRLNSRELVATRRNQAENVIRICESFSDEVERAEALDQRFGRHGFHQAVIQAVIERFQRADPAMRDPSPVIPPFVPPVPGVEALSDGAWLESIEIRNFKAIGALDLTFPAPQSVDGIVTQPWLMVLAENGVGKSSLLQAVALALMPEHARDDGTLRPAHTWLRRAPRVSKGSVRLTFSDGRQRTLSFQKGWTDFQWSGDAPPLPVLAYGATRLLPDFDDEEPTAPIREAVSVRNLFDPRYPLKNAERALVNKERVSEEQFDRLAVDLKALLPLKGSAWLLRGERRIATELHGTTMALDELSGGYQSVLALAMDIMFHLTGSSRFDMESAQGVVMIDEIELHLHPMWKIQIVEKLRRTFPRVRFIVSTHDALCVQGLRKGELRVMHRHPEDQQLRIESIDVPAGARADEILTGPWFGLQSTMDADTLALMAEHSALLQCRTLNARQKRDLQQMENELRHRMGTFGNTRSHRAALAAAAALEQERPMPSADTRIQARLQQILRDDPTGAEGEGA
ncbi:AAA family ATPase [Mitsuaria sp. BK037]|uniref:AAA family ATPase n=1 Tax=Mitsuaria sp. BK037 TaxID=2587122 RepID=UPI001622AF43|nr:AAA family ATPase [Mitsuaria sp. BK037]MBB3281894.1 uncharacterized protein (TIGR02646 family) [Mitsuaria sp. BK037]